MYLEMVFTVQAVEETKIILLQDPLCHLEYWHISWVLHFIIWNRTILWEQLWAYCTIVNFSHLATTLELVIFTNYFERVYK